MPEQNEKSQFLHILIPAYGDSPYLKEAIDSVLGAGFDETCKLTIVDDASPQDSIKLIADQFDGEVHYLKNAKNLGVGGNFKFCHQLSEAQLTLILGSDDRLKPGAISELKKLFLYCPNAAVFQLSTEIIDASNRTIWNPIDTLKKLISPKISGYKTYSGNNIFKRLAIGNFMYFPAIAWNLTCKNRIVWETNYNLAVDLNVLMHLANDGEMFAFTDKKLFQYRRHSESVSTSLAESGSRIEEEIQVHAKMYKELHWKGNILNKLILISAPTIRIHGIISAIRILFKKPTTSKLMFEKTFSFSKFSN